MIPMDSDWRCERDEDREQERKEREEKEREYKKMCAMRIVIDSVPLNKDPTFIGLLVQTYL